MKCFEIFAGIFGVWTHAAFSDDDAYTGLLYKFFFKFFHTHTGGRSDRNHFKFSIFEWTDDWSGMEDSGIADIDWKFAMSLYQAAVCHVAAGGQASV